MLVEFIIDKSEYKQLVKQISFKASNGIEISKRSLKANGKDNYYFRITHSKNELNSAKALSEIRCLIEKSFNDNNVDYRILLDESSQYFAKILYPLVMEFETKLRKFVHNTLFDISEVSTQKVLSQLKANLKNIDKNTNIIPKVDFLEGATLEDIHKFLFANNGLYGSVKDYISNKDNLCLSRKDLLDYISNNKQQTIWKDFFEPDFADSSLPQNYSQITTCRNDIMHFHYISSLQYDEYYSLMNFAIKDLDKQLQKGIVIESTTTNIEKLSNNLGYQQSIFTGLKGLDALPGVLSLSPELDALRGIINLPSLSPIYGIFNGAQNFVPSNLPDLIIPIGTILPQFDSLNDIAKTALAIQALSPMPTKKSPPKD